jgi:hypothetical protein
MTIKEAVGKKAGGIFRPLALQIERLVRSRKRRPLIVFGAIFLVVAIAVLIVYFVMQMGTVSFREPLYRYDTGIRLDYEGTTHIQRDDEEFFLKNSGRKEEIGNAPIYFPEEDKIFLTGQMVVIRPEEAKAPVRTGYFTAIEKSKEAGVFIAKINDKKVEIKKGFLFDGQDVYVFLEPMTVEWDEQSIELPAFSCAMVYYNQRLEIYPMGHEEEIAIEQTGEMTVTATAKSGAYSVDLSKDILKSQGNELLLFTQPSLLDFIS